MNVDASDSILARNGRKAVGDGWQYGTTLFSKYFSLRVAVLRIMLNTEGTCAIFITRIMEVHLYSLTKIGSV